jgi:formylglycine-generating enzyme required for sulfatase activity
LDNLYCHQVILGFIMKQIFQMSPWSLAGLALLVLLFFVTGPAHAKTARVTNALGMTFIKIQPGIFTMGSPAAEPHRDRDERQHRQAVTSTFYLQETEVTLGQWRAVMGKRWILKKKGWDNMPVTRVSWHDCIKYIERLNAKTTGTYRLPLEAEWEYACRAGTTTVYSWGNTIDCTKALYGNNTTKAGECTPYVKKLEIPLDGPAPVKTYAPNPWGLYDMHGNVWEWCQDIYWGDPSHPGKDTVLDAESRVRRGGSWYKHAASLRSANRTYAHPGARFKTTGFRLVLEAD